MANDDHALLVASSGSLRSELRRGLEACGLRVTCIDPLPDRSGITEAFATAGQNGAPTLILIALLPSPATLTCVVAEMEDAHWQAACRDLIRDTLHALQAAQAVSSPAGSAIVVLGPSFVFSGAPALVPLSTAAEAQRGLVKAAARQLGIRGITVNWIGINSVSMSPALSNAPLPRRDERIPVALGRTPALDEDIAAIVAFLATPAGRNITGASLCLDGGEWMLP